MGSGTGSTYQIIKAEYITEPDRMKSKDLFTLFAEYYLPKRNTYHYCNFLPAKQTEDETPETFWRQIEIDEKCDFRTKSSDMESFRQM